jgi:hypothetical protein
MPVSGYLGRPLVLLCLATLAGCATSPRNGQHYDDVGNILFNGLVPWATDPETGAPGANIQFDTFSNQYNAWFRQDSLAITAATSPSLTDSGGTPWFGYGKTFSFASLTWWTGSLSNHTMTMAVRPYVQGAGHSGLRFDPAHDFKLAIFDVGTTTDNCILNHENDTGGAIASACASTATEVTLVADCGTAGHYCCGSGWPSSTNYQCDAPSRCDRVGICGACGAEGQVPCHGSQCYPVTGGTECNLQCNSGLTLIPGNVICRKPAPAPPPPPPPARTTQSSSVNCTLQPFFEGYPQYDCTIFGDPQSAVKLVSITNPNTALQHSAALIKNFADAPDVCANPQDATADQYVFLAPGQTADLQSVIGGQPDVSGPFTYALCVLPSAVDGSDAAAYISSYTVSLL